MTGNERGGEARGRWNVPPNWPTNRANAHFWEELGRLVATFGMLEDTLTRTFYVASLKRRIEMTRELGEAEATWRENLEKPLSDTLGEIRVRLENEWRREEGGMPQHREELLGELTALGRERNRLCHGAWVGFGDDDVNTVRFFPKNKEMEGDHEQQVSMDDLRTMRERAAYCIAALIELVRNEYGVVFPGTPQG